MGFIGVYLMVGVMIGIMEMVSILLIRDNQSLWLKSLYGLLVALLWPLIVIVTWLAILAPKTTERIRVRLGVHG